jgi:hypothetical protein
MMRLAKCWPMPGMRMNSSRAAVLMPKGLVGAALPVAGSSSLSACRWAAGSPRSLNQWVLAQAPMRSAAAQSSAF